MVVLLGYFLALYGLQSSSPFLINHFFLSWNICSISNDTVSPSFPQTYTYSLLYWLTSHLLLNLLNPQIWFSSLPLNLLCEEQCFHITTVCTTKQEAYRKLLPGPLTLFEKAIHGGNLWKDSYFLGILLLCLLGYSYLDPREQGNTSDPSTTNLHIVRSLPNKKYGDKLDQVDFFL
jgi:hypothetical protein